MARSVILYFIIFHFPLILAKSWLCRGGRWNGIHQTLHCVMLLTFNAAFESNGEHCRLDAKLKRWISFTVHHNKIDNQMLCGLQTMIKARLCSQNTLFHLGNEYILSFSLILGFHLLCDIVENTFTVHTAAASPQSASALTVILRCHCDCDGSAKSWQSHTLRSAASQGSHCSLPAEAKAAEAAASSTQVTLPPTRVYLPDVSCTPSLALTHHLADWFIGCLKGDKPGAWTWMERNTL